MKKLVVILELMVALPSKGLALHLLNIFTQAVVLPGDITTLETGVGLVEAYHIE